MTGTRAEQHDQLSREGESSSSWCRTSLLLVILSYTLHTLLSPAQPGAGSTSQLICLCLHLNIGSVHTVGGDECLGQTIVNIDINHLRARHRAQ